MNGRSLRRAFQDPSVNAAKASVRILQGDRTIALGTVVGADGWILTKASQLEPDLTIEFANGEQFPATWVGYHRPRDLALLKIDATDLPVITWQETLPPLGSWMISVGPQTDPLSVGVMSVGRRRIRNQEPHGVLGISLESNDIARVREVSPQSGAEAAGLRSGDLIEQVDTTPVRTGRDLVRALENYRTGDFATLQVQRNQRPMSIGIRVGKPFQDLLAQLSLEQQLNGPVSRRYDAFEAVYQHDGVLTPEECGGPVVGLDGRAVGLNIARPGRVGMYLLPADLIVPLISDLQQGKYPPPAPRAVVDDAPLPETAEASSR